MRQNAGDEGIDTHHAFDASEAMEKLQAHPEIELMIVEVLLTSSGDGLDLAARVAAERPSVQLLIAAERGREPVAALPRGARLLRKPSQVANSRSSPLRASSPKVQR